mmetsp:Transcript_9572/g.23499  ORF Transcript_9572/g.23499 Transcript_9572/m.23499 type:complete len:99 (-) Transcript_9572:1354-1650(-)
MCPSQLPHRTLEQSICRMTVGTANSAPCKRTSNPFLCDPSKDRWLYPLMVSKSSTPHVDRSCIERTDERDALLQPSESSGVLRPATKESGMYETAIEP